MPSTFSRTVLPTAVCHRPACSPLTCCGSWRIAARTRAHVSSAVAYDGVPACRLLHTTTPLRLHASISMCGNALRWLMSRSCGRRSSSGRDGRALADEHQGLGVEQAISQHVDVVDVIGPRRDLVVAQALE